MRVYLGFATLLLVACGADVEQTIANKPVTSDTGWAYASLEGDVRDTLLTCGVDAAAFDGLVRLPQQDFDQDFDGGWRSVAERDGCNDAAGELILAYMHYSAPRPPTDMSILRWHAGQMKAYAGKTEQALALFAGTYGDSDDLAWNLYVDATLAFLQNDLAGIETAYAQLSGLDVSEELQAARQKFLDDNPQVTMPDGFVTEPQNLSVVSDLRDCFGKPYSEAYGGCD